MEEIYVQQYISTLYQHVDRQSGCDVMVIFENVKNIPYRYQRLRLGPYS